METTTVNNNKSTELFNIENIFVYLSDINRKLSDILPRVANIEEKLKCLDEFKSDRIQIESIKSEFEECKQKLVLTSDSVTSFSDSSSSVTDSDQSDCLTMSEPEAGSPDCVQHGLVMSDSDLTEFATKAGTVLGCQVAMQNYSGGGLEPAMFEQSLEFVYIQDSGKLDRYQEVTNEIIEEMRAYVQELVKLSSSILQLQPATRVFLGSLPPRYDGRVMEELTRLFNSLLLTESVHEERITVVSQSQLNCKYDNKKFERLEWDLVTLTKYGTKLRDKNVFTQIAQDIPGLKVKQSRNDDHRYKLGRAWPRIKSNKKIKSFLEDLLRSI